MNAHTLLDKTAVRNSFSLAADSYDSVAALQRRVGENLYAKIGRHSALAQSMVLDIGCGTGFLTAKLSTNCRQLLALDIALPMLNKTRTGLRDYDHIDYLCADTEALPLADNSVDCIVSNLSLQWCQDLNRVFSEFQRVLSAKGSIHFSTFGANTLQELKAAWGDVDDYAHVNYFYNSEELKDALTRAGFKKIKLNAQTSISNYVQVRDLMQELKAIGAHNVNRERIKTLTGKNRMNKMATAYEHFRQHDLLPATFEIIYASAD